MRPLAVLVLATLTAGALAGCFGDSTSPVEVTPYLPLLDAAPGRTVQFAFFLESTDAFKQVWRVGVENLPAGWTFVAATPEVTLPGRETRPLVVDVTPAADARFGPQTLRVMVGDTPAEFIVHVQDAGAIAANASAGVRLQYVAWTENGTLAAWNHPNLRNQTDIPALDDAPQGIAPATAGGTAPLRGWLGDHPPPPRYAEEGYVALPAAWREALLTSREGGARAGDVIVVREAPGVAGLLLHVLEVVPDHSVGSGDGGDGAA